MKKIYLVCPVRDCDDETRKLLDVYVCGLEASGECQVHYPHRDVDQTGTADEICSAHVLGMSDCDEVHFWWDHKSRGSLFDFGMAYMMRSLKTSKYIRFVLVNRDRFENLKPTGYTKYLMELDQRDNEKD